MLLKCSNTDLASRVLIAYLHFFYSHDREEEETGGRDILSKKELIVQKLSSEPKPVTMKFTKEWLREFVEYNYDEIFLENVKEAFTQHFKEKQNCDVLPSEQDLHVLVWTNYLV